MKIAIFSHPGSCTCIPYVHKINVNYIKSSQIFFGLKECADNRMLDLANSRMRKKRIMKLFNLTFEILKTHVASIP